MEWCNPLFYFFNFYFICFLYERDMFNNSLDSSLKKKTISYYLKAGHLIFTVADYKSYFTLSWWLAAWPGEPAKQQPPHPPSL